MRKKLFVLLLLSSVASAADIDIFGYIEPQLTWINFGDLSKADNWGILNTNKLRLDIEAKPAKNVKIGANVNFLQYSGETTIDLNDLLPATNAANSSVWMLTYQDETYLDNAYIRLSFDLADLTIGKQQISYGTGYAWNPTDILNYKDTFDPTYEQTGIPAVRLDVPIGQSMNFLGIYATNDNWREPTFIGRFSGQIGRFELSGSAMTKGETVTEYIIPGDYGIQTGMLRRHGYGFDFVGELLGIGVWGEGAYFTLDGLQDSDLDDEYFEGLLGTDYTFRSELYILAEYYYNGSGRANRAADNSNYSYWYEGVDWFRYLTGEKKTLGRDQGFLYIDYPLFDIVRVGGSALGCVNDESIAFIPQINWSAFQNVDITAFGYLYTGATGTMYSRELGGGGLLRLRAYF